MRMRKRGLLIWRRISKNCQLVKTTKQTTNAMYLLVVPEFVARVVPILVMILTLFSLKLNKLLIEMHTGQTTRRTGFANGLEK